MPTIGFDAKRIVRNASGLGNYSRTLINGLASLCSDGTQLRLYAPDPGRTELREQVVQCDNVTFVYPRRAGNALAKALWRSHGIVDYLLHDGVTLFHGLSGELPIGIAQAGIPAVVTIHDIIFWRHPEFYKPIDVALYKWKLRHTCREATRFIAISERTKLDLMQLCGVPEERIDVVYQSCGTRFRTLASDEERAAVRQRCQLPSRYILSVGTIEKRKNALLALQALEHLPQDVHLVLVGRATPYAQTIADYARRHSLTARLHIVSNVGNADLPAVYQMAEAFVYPSRYEGFGIPIIEAIQSGVPVVAAKGSCLEEAGGPDSLYVDADRPDELAAAVSQILPGSDFREARIARSRDYISRFECSATAQKVMEVYEKIIK